MRGGDRVVEGATREGEGTALSMESDTGLVPWPGPDQESVTSLTEPPRRPPPAP